MATTEQIPYDKSSWGDGPWQTEPDRVEWRDEATGYTCLITRHRSFGNLCGYVAVPPGHPLHGKEYEDVDLYAHGGVNYSDACSGQICHVPAPGEPDNVWWFGFDCSHMLDYSPALDMRTRKLMGDKWTPPVMPEVYRELDYVREVCTELARQLYEQSTQSQTTTA
jgi:hypothetical protein